MSEALPEGNAWIRWLHRGEDLNVHTKQGHKRHPWYLVIWLTGVDYFSTLGYQPGIALLAAGALSPIATTVLVLVTLLCALPIYSQVAGRSYVGLGSIALLENLLAGWWGKVLVLVLLGFAGTDFVITMTLSAADAAQHAIENPYLHPLVRPFQHHAGMIITLLLLALLAAVFLKGFAEAIELATAVCVPYLFLNAIVLVRALEEVLRHPTLLLDWQSALFQQHGGNWTGLALASLLVFPKLALGLSGFETGVSVMPLIRGGADDPSGPGTRDAPPRGLIRNTRKLLATAAIIMSVMLVLSSFVTALLIPELAWRAGGRASGRAIAYLAHELLGNVFGSVYDISTILILWFAGASAMAGLLHLIPRYLPRLGLAPEWVAYARPLVLVLFSFNVVITLIFRANVEAQGGAYATGVLVLMLSASIAAALSCWRERRFGIAIYCWAVAVVFGYTTLANIVERPDGIIIASFFIVFILVVSVISRYVRATELREAGITFCDAESEAVWNSIVGKHVNLVPVRSLTKDIRAKRLEKIRRYYKVEGPLVFVHVELLDNRSEFLSPLALKVTRDGDDVLIEASQAVAIANAIAYLSELLHPAAIFLGLTRQHLMRQSLRYFLLGEGESGLMVYRILERYWERKKEEHRPCIFLMAD
jgi:hypothetical protein